MGNRHTIYAVNTSGGLIDGCRSNEIDEAITTIVEGTDGKVDPEFAAIMNAEPNIGFETRAIATGLGIAGISGLGYVSALTAYLQALTQGGTRAGTGSHFTVASAAGLLIPRTLTAQQNSPAMLSLMAYCRSSDGLTHPWTITGAQDLGGSPVTDELFTLGPCNLAGSLLTEIVDVSVDFGITITSDPSTNGLPYPTFYAILERKPTIRIRTKDGDALDDFGPGGLAIDASVDIYFRKIAEGGTRIANATASHIKISVDEGIIHVGTWTGEHAESGGVEINIVPTYDGTNAILAISTGSAIT